MKEFVYKCRHFFYYAAAFSVVMNVLMLATPLFMLHIMDRVLVSRSTVTLVMLGLIAVFAVCIEFSLEYLRSRLLTRASVALQSELQTPVLDFMLSSRKEKSDRARHAMEDVYTVQSFISGKGFHVVFELPWLPVWILIMYLLHPVLVYISILGALLLWILAWCDDRFTSRYHKQSNLAQRKSQDFLDIMFRNSGAISALGMRKRLIRRWDVLQQEFLKENDSAAAAGNVIQSLSSCVRVLLRLMMLATAAYIILNDQSISAGIMIAATIILGRLMSPIERVIGAWKSFVLAKDAYFRLESLLKESTTQASSLSLPPPRGHLSVENLYFGFKRGSLVLNGLRFSLLPGENLGIIGNSGAGKTSLSKLLVGLLDADRGEIRLDGANIHQWLQNDLGNLIGYLPQETELFPGTVAENIARMSDDATDSEKVVEAAMRAGAHEMVLRLPNGYETMIGERGHVLSSGQAKLICLARAIFGNPRYIVMDEPDASLDGPSEMALMNLILELKRSECTVVVVTHKPAMLRDIDKVLVLDKGRQVMFGLKDKVLPQVTQDSQRSFSTIQKQPEKLAGGQGKKAISAPGSPKRQGRRVPVKFSVIPFDGVSHMATAIVNANNNWFNGNVLKLRLNFDLICVFSDAPVSGFAFSDIATGIWIDVNPQCVGSPRYAKKFPAITWAGSSRYIFKVITSLPTQPQDLKLLARCGDEFHEIAQLSLGQTEPRSDTEDTHRAKTDL